MKKSLVFASGQVVTLISTKLPQSVEHKAEQLIEQIALGEVKQGAKKKILKRNKTWVSLRVTRRYRLVVKRTNLESGPYICMPHNQFDKRVNSL